MYKVAVIGAGQLGSRHLQGLKGAASPLSITVMDNKKESLQVSKERYETIPAIGEKIIEYVTSIQELPKELDLVIIATDSRHRAAIIKSLLEYASVRYLVLEKVLFPVLNEFEKIAALLKAKHVRCWVNCPRRMFGSYKQIKETIDISKPIYMTNADEDWGLCCNAIHMIDLFLYLTEEISYTVETRLLNKKIEESKRSGYIEMTGALRIITPNRNELILVSEKNFKGEKNFMVENGDNIYGIFEGEGFWYYQNQKHDYAVPYQSQLTGILSDEILKTGGCSLTPFWLSSLYHKPFIEALLAKYNEIKGTPDNKLLPIT
jgi:hypothetical protein